jgi:hypothetical protein
MAAGKHLPRQPLRESVKESLGNVQKEVFTPT